MNITDVDNIQYALEINHLGFLYTKKKKSLLTRRQQKSRFDEIEVLDDVSFKMRQGEFIVLGGEHGCGKSTLLRLIAGFDYPYTGEIYINNTLYSSPDYLLDPEFRRIGLVFQDYALFPQMTVAQNIRFGISHLTEDEQQYKMNQILKKTQLEQYANTYPKELSIVQMQLVALARALVIDPILLLIDEPFHYLGEKKLILNFVELLKELTPQDTMIVMATSEMRTAVYLADNIKMMDAGKLIQEGTPEDVYLHPATKKIAGHFDNFNLIPVEQTKRNNLISPLGEIHPSNIRNFEKYEGQVRFHLCIRPSMFQVLHTKKTKKCYNIWQVVRITFMGSIYKLRLVCEDEQYQGLKIFVVQGIETDLPHVGDKVSVEVISKELWALD